MKEIKKFKLNSNHVAIIVVASVLLFFTLAAIIINSVIAPLIAAGQQGGNQLPPILDGEDYYANMTVAYPRISSDRMEYVMVNNSEGYYELIRSQAGYMTVQYRDSNGEEVIYAPPIMDAEGSLTYDKFYALSDQSSAMAGAQMLTWLYVAIGTLYFDSRITLPEGENERRNMLLDFGFDPDNMGKQSVGISYLTDDKSKEPNKDGTYPQKSEQHALYIGGQPISGVGYYYMVDNRDSTVYYTANENLAFALYGVEKFIKGNLVIEGLDRDFAFEPYLTTDFKIWKNTVCKTVGATVEDDSIVICTGSSIIPRNAAPGFVLPEGASSDYYIYEPSDTLTFDLQSKLIYHTDYLRFKKMLVGAARVGVYADEQGSGDSRLYLTMLSNRIKGSTSKEIDFSSGAIQNYTYDIYEIESVIGTDRELIAEGTPVGDASLVKVAYTYKIGDKTASSGYHHAVLDLSSPLIPEKTREALRASTVGKLPTDGRISFTVAYTPERAVQSTEKLIITAITGIYNKKGEPLARVSESSYVTFTYYETVNGAPIADTVTVTDSIAEMRKNGEKWTAVADVLMGRSAEGELNIEAYTYEGKYEIMREFVTYAVSSVDSFVTSKPTLSFNFVNASERDPFYGETYYKNTMLGAESLYGLNSDSCENLVRYLGGISSNTNSAGFSGETVEIGITADVMEQYGLYANRIYFELPRGISDMAEQDTADDPNADKELEEGKDPNEGASDKLAEYRWLGTIGFTLYVSDKKYEEDGRSYRNVGSDMYDLVAKVYDAELDFVDKSFEELWARRNLVMMKIQNLDEIIFDFNMEDVFGAYKFDYYYGQVTGPDGSTLVDVPFVDISVGGDREDRMDTELEKYLVNENGENVRRTYSISLLYDKVHGQLPSTDGDTTGVANFKELNELVALTRYTGILTDDERRSILSGEAGDAVMTMYLKLTSSPGYYAYEFYRFDDRRVGVVIYETTSDGNPTTERACSFYVSTFAFKKLVANAVGLLNAEMLDINVGYYDE